MKIVALTLVGISIIGCAHAATYTLENVVQTKNYQAQVPSMSISVTDLAVARGSFSYSSDYLPLSPVGNAADLINFNFGNDIILSDGTGASYYHLIIKLTFSGDSSISRASIYYQTLSPELTLSGSGSLMSGLYQPYDGNECQSTFDCRILSAQLVRTDLATSVPEPSSLIILSGLGSARLLRRRFVKYH